MILETKRTTGKQERLQYLVLCVADEWVKCDDDNMSTTTTEQILKLSGGGTFSNSPQHISSQRPKFSRGHWLVFIVNVRTDT